MPVKIAATSATIHSPYSLASNALEMISSFEKKPDNGGTPTIASHATVMASAVYGRKRLKRPMIRMSWPS